MPGPRLIFGLLLGPVVALVAVYVGLPSWMSAGIGAMAATALLASVRNHAPSRVAVGAVLAGVGAVFVFGFVREAVGAGIPGVRSFADGVWLGPLLALGFALLALRDHPSS